MKYFPFVLKILLACGTWLSCLLAFGQSPSDLALKNIQKQKWQRAHYLLTKAVTKDSLNVTAKYVLAQYFFSKENPAYNLDTAYHIIEEALLDFQQTTHKQRDRLKRFPVDSIILIKFKDKIDSVAFQREKKLNSEDSFVHFLRYFPTSPRRHLAIDARDSIAFSAALKTHTSEALQHFLNTYPEAKQKKTAQDTYDQLLFEERTSDKKLESYESFITDFSDSPFKKSAEKIVFEYRTADGSVEAFRSFIQRYPHSEFVKRAKNILFYLVSEFDRSSFAGSYLSNDSLDAVIRSTDTFLIPFLKNKKFGFMDAEGNELIPAAADSISSNYLCGNITDDVILLPEKIVSKTGTLVQLGTFAAAEDLGYGFLLVTGENCSKVIHKSGFRVGGDCIDEAKIVAGKFVASMHDNYWSVWTFTGRLLAEGMNDLFWIDDIIVAKVNDKYTLTPASQLAKLPQQDSSRSTEQYDEVKPWEPDLILVIKDNRLGIYDQSLRNIVPITTHQLSHALSCIVASTPEATFIYKSDGEKCLQQFQQVAANEKWIVAKSDTGWKFYDSEKNSVFGVPYDTIAFKGPFAIGNRQDSITVHFSKMVSRRWADAITAEFIPGQDSLSFVAITEGERTTIYSHRGERLFSTSAEKIQYIGCHLFVVQKNEKKGLVSQRGKQILSPEYEAIGTPNRGLVSLLKSTKFGVFNCEQNRLIQPAYDKNIQPYNADYAVASKGGLVEFLNWNGKASSGFEFNEVQFWNDTSALVRKNALWMIYDLGSRKILVNNIKDLAIIHDTPLQRIAIVHQGGKYGVFDSKKGTILPLSFSYIINVGSAEEPLYFTETHVKESQTFEVAYYTNRGKMIRKENYDQDDYDAIYCDHR